METKVLDYLDFHLSVTTSYTFMQRYLKAAGADTKTKHLASYLAELSLPAYEMLKYEPSKIGAAAVYLARLLMHTTQDKKVVEIWVSASSVPLLLCCPHAHQRCVHHRLRS